MKIYCIFTVLINSQQFLLCNPNEIEAPVCEVDGTCDDYTPPTCTAKYEYYNAWDGTLHLGVPTHISFADKCNVNDQFFVDSTMKKIYLMMDSAGKETPILKVYDPQGEIVDLSKPFAANASRVGYELSNPDPGVWSVHFTSSHACLFVLHANTNLTINSGFIPGPDAQSDDPEKDMQQNLLQYYIARANSLEKPGDLVSLEIWERSDKEGYFQLRKSFPVRRRKNCTHDVYFGPFKCTKPQNLYYFKIIGVDQESYTFERTRVARCFPAKET